MSSSPISNRIVALYVNGDDTVLDDLYAREAVVDVNVDQSRYQLRGSDFIAALIRAEELGVPGRKVSSWRTGSTDDGLFLEIEVRFHDGDDRMWRSLHLFSVGDGRIAKQTVYCSGIWDAADIAHYDAQGSLADA